MTHPVASFYGPKQHHSARRRRVMLFFVVILGIVACLEGYRGWHVVQDVRQGRASLRAGQQQLEAKRLDATQDDLEGARRDFDAAGVHFGSARSTLASDPFVTIARHVPFIGGQANATVSLAEIGEQGAAIGLSGVGAAEAFDAAKGEGHGTLPEKTVQVFDSVDPYIASIQSRLTDVDTRRSEIGSDSLLPPVRSALTELDSRRARLRDFLDTYTRARAFAPEFLGFSGPKTYLVLAQNNAELLPTGGLVSVVGTIRLNNGKLEDMQFQDAVQFGEDWMARTHQYVEPPAPLKQYLLKDTSWNLLVSNWSPDFPTAAQSATRFFDLGGGQHVDGVIGINVTTLQRLLEVTGPVDVPDFGATVTSDNAYELTEQYTRIPYEPQADRKAFAALLADEVLRRVLHPVSGQWSELLDVTQRLGDEKDMLLYSFDQKQEALIKEWGWDGGVRYKSGDQLMLVDASVNSTKLNAVITHSANVDVVLDHDGSATTTVTVNYNNDLASWERGKDPDLVTKLMLGGLYGGYVRLLAPPGSRILSVRQGGTDVGIEEVSRENGLAVFGRFFALPRDTKQTLVFTYKTPPVIEKQGDTWTYQLDLQRQPGWELPVNLQVRAPDGMHRASTMLDGATVAPPGADGMKIDLSRDRVITMRFKAGS
jgi:Protein of unknown function (DUF4012)